MLPFGAYRPDVAETNPGISRNVWNVNPRRDSQGVSYHPRRKLSVADGSAALPGAPRGALAMVTRDGSYNCYFGTETSLYRMLSPYEFDEIGTGYSVTPGQNWGLCQYGDHLLATNTFDGLFEWNIETGVAVVAVPDAPAARSLFVWAEMIIALDCDGDNRMMQNSAPGSYTNWKTKGAQKSPFADGEALMGGGTLNDGQAAIIQRGAVRILSVTGTERIFRVDKVSEVGALNPECIVQAPGALYFMDSSGPQVVTAQGAAPIGDDKIARTFMATLEDVEGLTGAYDPERKQVVWRKSAGELLVYDIPTQEFVPVLEETSAIIKMSNPALTLEALDIYGTLDALPYSLDSNAWKGGRPRLAALDNSYTFGFFDGPYLKATVETSTLTDSVSMLVTSVTPVTDAANATVRLGMRDRLADTTSYKDAVSMQPSGRAPTRGRGKCLVVEVEIAEGETWTYIRGIDAIDIKKGGPR